MLTRYDLRPFPRLLDFIEKFYVPSAAYPTVYFSSCRVGLSWVWVLFKFQILVSRHFGCCFRQVYMQFPSFAPAALPPGPSGRDGVLLRGPVHGPGVGRAAPHRALRAPDWSARLLRGAFFRRRPSSTSQHPERTPSTPQKITQCKSLLSTPRASGCRGGPKVRGRCASPGARATSGGRAEDRAAEHASACYRYAEGTAGRAVRAGKMDLLRGAAEKV